MGEWGPDGTARRPGEGVRVDVGPHWLEVLARGAETEDSLGAFVFTHEPIRENPPHAHLDYTKLLYVLEGDYAIRVGDAVFEAKPGTLVIVPRASQHAFTTKTGGRILFVCSPSGNEEMFLEIGRIGPELDAAGAAELYERFHTVELPGDANAPWHP